MDVDDDVVDLSVGPSEKSASAATGNLETSSARDLRALAQNNSLSITPAPPAAAAAAAQTPAPTTTAASAAATATATASTAASAANSTTDGGE